MAPVTVRFARRSIARPTLLVVVGLLLGGLLQTAPAQADVPHVLVYSATYGYRHSSIETGNATLQRLADDTGAFTVEFSDLPTDLTAQTLDGVDVLLLNSTTGKYPLTGEQKTALERFWGCGGGAVGIHAATDANYGWTAYAELFGAQFQSHPHGAGHGPATLRVENPGHPVNTAYGEVTDVAHADEYYRWIGDVRGVAGVTPLLSLDTTTVANGGPGSANAYAEDQPVSWVKTFRGRGRVFVNNLGHNAATWGIGHFQQSLVDGIAWVAGQGLDDACFGGTDELPAAPVAPAPSFTPGDAVQPCVVGDNQTRLTADGVQTTLAAPGGTRYGGGSFAEFVLDLGHPLFRADLDVALGWDAPLADYDLAVTTPWTIAGSDAIQPLASAGESVRVPAATSCATIIVAAYNHVAFGAAPLTLTIDVSAQQPEPTPQPPIARGVPAELGAPVCAYPNSTGDGRYCVDDYVLVEGSTLSFVNADVGIAHTVDAIDYDPVTYRALFSSGSLDGPGATPIAGVEDLRPGTYGFFCAIHPDMTGTLAVLPAS